MDKAHVIWTLKEMGDLLEISEANAFEIMAYRGGMRSLEDFEGDLAGVVEAGTLTDLRGIGKGLSQVISDLVRTGRSEEHERIRGLFPEGLPELLRLSGIGPKKVKTLWTELEVSNLDELEAAARAERVSALRGFGKKTEERIIASIERRRARKLAPSVRTPSKKRAPVRKAVSGSGRLLAGTSGYAYKEWKGSFYPDDLPTTRFLEHYASRFDTVEINNSFYRFPSESALSSWAERTPDGFLFAVKANQRISHRLRLKNAEEVTASFVERCSVLGERLGPILIQLPPNVKRDDAVLADFVACLPEGGRYAMEFRHETWFDDAVFSALSDGGVALVVHDDEKLDMPRVATADFLYARLRRGTYDEKALDDWNAWFSEVTSEKRDVFAYLKHKAGSSPERILARWLEERARPARRMAKSAKKRRPAARKREANER